MFGIILPGRPCLTNLSSVSPTQLATSFPSSPHFSHIVVFMLPGNALPDETVAAVYLQLPGQPQFKLLGALGNEKQSAIFQITLPATVSQPAQQPTPVDQPNGTLPPDASLINLGISVEPKAAVQAQLATSPIQPQPESSALVRHAQPSPKVLAQRIIVNAFNFLASYSGHVADGQEVVPLKAFQDWWTKFERKIEIDPAFLERDADG